MPADHLPMPCWTPRSGRPMFLRSVAKAATKAWALAALYFLGKSASALSKRLSSDHAKAGTNSKYIYSLIAGKHEIYPRPRGRLGHSWFATVDAYGAGHCATDFYYQPWELMVQDVSLDRVCQLCYHALERSFSGDGIDTFFYFYAVRGLPEGEAWRRKPSRIWKEAEVLWDDAERWVADNNDRQWQVFDRLTVVWCLYREAILLRHPLRAIYYREKIFESHAEVAGHPVFSLVFDEYRRCAKCALEADGLPARKDINRQAVERLAKGGDAEQYYMELMEIIPDGNKLAYALLKHRRQRPVQRDAGSAQESDIV